MGSYTAAFILVTLSVLFTVIQSQEHIRIKRRMYAMCPPKFQRIGSECYAISDQPANWLEAHFQCKDKNSKLAEPNNRSDRKLRAFFQRMDHDSDEIWIGATFDWHINTWQWSISGKNLSYDAFSRLDPESRQNLEYHCAVLNPSLKYRWSARSCVDKHRYICQHKMPKVSEKNRFKVYNRWNQTFPNQLANEVELEVIDTKTKDGVRTHRRVKPMDSSENYPMPSRRPSQPEKQRRRPYVPSRDTDNEVNVRFIPNYITNEINGGVSYQTPVPATVFPLSMEFIPANNDVQAAQAYMETTTKRSRHPTNTQSSDNETVDQVKQPTNKRVKTTFDKLNEEKRRLERERKRAEHRRRKQMRLRKMQEVDRKAKEEERKKEEEDRKKEEEERKNQEAERKRQEQAAIDELKAKQAEEEKQVKEQEEATLAQRQKLEAQREKDKKDKLRQEEEAKLMQEKREEEEDRLRKQRLHEENRLRLEYEERVNKEQQTERELKLEEEKRVAEENQRRSEQEERARQEELKRLQEEDEKRLELQRMEIDRKRQEEELARLEEENRKRIAAQKKREEEIRRREEALTAQLEEEKRLQEELRIREEQDRLLHEQEIQREIEEKKQKEEAERLEQERKEEIRKQKEKKLREKIDIEAQNLEQEEERKKKEKIRKYAERISRLSPEMQKKFMEARKNRKKNHKNSDNEVSIPERK